MAKQDDPEVNHVGLIADIDLVALNIFCHLGTRPSTSTIRWLRFFRISRIVTPSFLGSFVFSSVQSTNFQLLILRKFSFIFTQPQINKRRKKTTNFEKCSVIMNQLRGIKRGLPGLYKISKVKLNSPVCMFICPSVRLTVCQPVCPSPSLFACP